MPRPPPKVGKILDKKANILHTFGVQVVEHPGEEHVHANFQNGAT